MVVKLKVLPKERLIVDEMCGKLAKWLRLLGFDTVYIKNTKSIDEKVDDDYILSKAILENRILVTRDVNLYNRAIKIGIKAILIDKDDIASKLAKVLDKITNSRVLEIRPRCPTCNNELHLLNKKRFEDKLPRNVYRFYDKILYCNKCDKAYWFGSHWDTIREIVSRIGYRLKVR